MAKFCGNCGAASDDNAKMCGNCGAPFAESKSGVGGILAKIPGVNNINIKPEQKELITKIAKIAVPAIVGLVAVLLIIFKLIVPNTGAQGALKKFYKAISKTDVAAYIELMPEAQKVYYEDEDDLNDDTEEYLQESLELWEEDYGDNVKFTVKVTKVKELKKKELNEIKDRYEGNDELDEDDITKGVEIKFELKVKGKEDKDSDKGTAILIKENGKWKVWSIDGIDL